MLRCCLPNLRSAGGRNVLLSASPSWLRKDHASSILGLTTQLKSVECRLCDNPSPQILSGLGLRTAILVDKETPLAPIRVNPTSLAVPPDFARSKKSIVEDADTEQSDALLEDSSSCTITQIIAESKLLCPPKPVPSKAVALRTLNSFLSPGNISSSSPTKIPLNTLYHLYRLLKTVPRFRRFTASKSSTLLDILGASLTGNKHPFGQMLDVSMVRSLMEIGDEGKILPAKFIIRVAADWVRCGHALRSSDRYWLMRAHLAELQGRLVLRDPIQNNARSQHESLRQARLHYNFLQKLSPHPSIHTPYLRTLMDVARSDLTNSSDQGHCWEEMIQHLCTLLKSHKHIHPSLLEVLQQVVLKPVKELSAEQKKHLVLSLRKRTAGLELKSSSTSFSSDVVPVPAAAVAIQYLATAITDTLFSSRPPPGHLRKWAYSVVHGAMNPEPFLSTAHIDQLLQNVVLLSFVNAPPSRIDEHDSPTVSLASSTSSRTEVDWHVVCILSYLERQLNIDDVRDCTPLNRLTLQKTNSVIQTVWQEWVSFDDKATRREDRPDVVVVAVMSSFLYLSGKTKDAQLLASCFAYCTHLNLLSQDALTAPSGTQPVLVEYIIASLSSTHTAGWDHILSRLLGFLSHLPTQTRISILDQVIRRHTQSNETLSTAHSFVLALRRYDTSVSTDVIQALARRLARAGHLDDALTYIYPTRYILSADQQMTVMATISGVIADSERDTNSTLALGSSLARGLIRSLTRLFTELGSSTPLQWRAHLNYSLLAMARASDASLIVPIVNLCVRGQPSRERFFTAKFWTSLFKILLAQQRFRTALRAFDFLLRVQQYSSESLLHWKRLLFDRFVREEATIQAFKIQCYRTVDKSERRFYMEDRHHIRDAAGRNRGLRQDRSIATYTLKLPQMLLSGDTLELDSCLAVMDALIRAGRLAVAKRLYMEIHSRWLDQEAKAESTSTSTKGPTAAEVHTILGNTILHAACLSRTRRNAQLVRKVRVTLNELVLKHKFVPDRVSVNILMKATLKWKGDTVDWEVVRALFDRLVRGGYPTFGIVKEGEVPFGTVPPGPVRGVGTAADKTGTQMETGVNANTLIAQVGTSISWKRHAKPLYKMIIKALYLRGDTLGARKVVAILKAGDVQCKMDREVRERARKLGRIKATERQKKKGSQEQTR